MRGQTSLEQAALSRDAASRRNARFLWTGFGFAVLMLIGTSACYFLPIATRASAKASRHVPTVAFTPYQPTVRRVDIYRDKDTLEDLAKQSEDQKVIQEKVQRFFGSLMNRGSSLQKESSETFMTSEDLAEQIKDGKMIQEGVQMIHDQRVLGKVSGSMPKDTLPGQEDTLAGLMTSEELAEENQDQTMIQEEEEEEVQRGLGKMSGSPQRSKSPMMMSVLDQVKTDTNTMSSKELESARASLEKLFASPPTPAPPPPTTPPPNGGGGGDGAAFYLKPLPRAEADLLLDDWIKVVKYTGPKRAQIGDESFAPKQNATMTQLESFRSFIGIPRSMVPAGGVTPVRIQFVGGNFGDKAFYGFYDQTTHQPLAIVGGRSFPSERTAIPRRARGTLEIKYMSVHPEMEMRVNPALEMHTSGLWFPAMKRALGDLAKQRSLTLVWNKVYR